LLLSKRHKRTDTQPERGKNHYRIRQVFGHQPAIYSTTQTQNFFLSENNITLFPNPAKETIQLYLKSLQDKEATIQIYNAFGQLVQQTPTQVYESAYQTIDLNNLENGIYLMSLKVEQLPLMTKRFVVENLK